VRIFKSKRNCHDKKRGDALGFMNASFFQIYPRKGLYMKFWGWEVYSYINIRLWRLMLILLNLLYVQN